MLGDLTILKGLLEAYIEGDTMARKALMDWLEEYSDVRLEEVREEELGWDAVAMKIVYPGTRRRSRRRRPLWSSSDSTLNHTRWLIDCARVGSAVPPGIEEAVQEARRTWLRKLFPEVEL